MQNSSSSKKIAIVAIVAIIIVAGYLVFKKPSTSDVSQTQANTPETATTSQGANAAAAVPTDPAVSQVQASGSSDQDLSNDTAAIDAQYSGFASDSNAAVATSTTAK